MTTNFQMDKSRPIQNNGETLMAGGALRSRQEVVITPYLPEVVETTQTIAEEFPAHPPEVVSTIRPVAKQTKKNVVEEKDSE